MIPDSLEPFGYSDGSVPLYILPVTLLPKIPPALMRFDFDCEDGRLSLPLRRQNALASYAALLHAAANALSIADPRSLPTSLREELLFVAAAPPEYAVPFAHYLRAPRRGFPAIPDRHEMPALTDAESDLDAWAAHLSGNLSLRRHTGPRPVSHSKLQYMHQVLAADSLSSWLLKSLAVSSVVLAHVEAGRQRRKVVRLSYDAAIFKDRELIGANLIATLGWGGVNLVLETPYVGAHSYHFEFTGTDGVEVFDSQLLSDDSGEPGSGPAASGPLEERANSRFKRQDSNRVHHYWSDTTSVDQVSAIVRLRIARQNFVGAAFWASLAVAVSVLACGALAQPLVRHGAGAAALLLLFPGLAATLVASTSRHPLISRVLARAHTSLYISAVCAYLTAAILPFIHTGGKANAATWVRVAWLALGVAATLQACLLYLARKLPRRPDQTGRLERGLDWFQRQALDAVRWMARQRQRRVRLAVSTPTLTWRQASQLAEASRSRRRLFAAPRRRGTRRDRTELVLCVEPPRSWRWRTTERPPLLERVVGRTPVLRQMVKPAARWPLFGRPPKRTHLRTSARPTDMFLNQTLGMKRRLSETARWLGRTLPDGYEFEAHWSRRGSRCTQALGKSLSALRCRAHRKPGKAESHGDAIELAPDEFARLLRDGRTRLNQLYRVSSR